MNNETLTSESSGETMHTKPWRSRRKIPFTAFAFSLQYAFYSCYFRDFPNGPVGAVVRSAGAGVEAVSICILLSFALGISACFISSWMQLVYKSRPLKIVLLLCAFLSVMLLPLVSPVWLIFVLAIIGAFCAGTVMGRSLYTALFMSMDIHPSLIVFGVYIIFQPIIMLYERIPALRTLPMFYAVGAPMMLAGLLFFIPFDGEEMERKRVLPENKLRLTDIWPSLTFFVLAQISFAFYEVMLLPQMPTQPLDQTLRIIPNAAAFIIFFFFGRKISIRSVLITYVVVFSFSVLAFLTGMGKAAVYMFTESSYRFYDLFFFWLLLSSFRMYGRNNTRLKLFISINVALGVVVIMLAQLIFPLLPTETVDAIPLFVIAVGLFLLIPKVEQTIKTMDAQGEYAESRHEYEVPLPDQREDVLLARDAMLRTLPPDVMLTAEEQSALAYMIDGQDADVTSHFLNVSISKVNKLTVGITAKFGCSNKNELIAIMSAARAEFNQRERMLRLIGTDSLTQNEKSVALLLVEGKTRSEITRKLRMKADDANRHVESIRNKLIGTGDPDPNVAVVAERYALTGRERDMLRCLCRDMTNAAIAADMFLSEGTVRIHVRNLLKKLPIDDRRNVASWVSAFETE